MDKIIQFILEFWQDIKPFMFVQQYKKGVHLRFGKFLRILEPGLHFKIPFIDEYILEYVKHDTMTIGAVNVTTLDGQSIIVDGQFGLEVDDIELALIETNDWRSNLKDKSKGVLSDILEDKNWEDIRKKVTKNAIEKKIIEHAEKMGVIVYDFTFTDKVMVRSIKLHGNVINTTNG